MNIVIAGGTGLVGSALMRQWSGDGHKIVILTRRPQPLGLLPGVRHVGWDGKSLGAWVKVLNGADAVVNVTGASVMRRWTPAYKRELVNSRVLPTSLLVSAMSKAAMRPAVFVSMSAAGYYAGHPFSERCSEQTPRGTGFLSDLCAQWEAAAAPARELGVRVVHPRMGVVLARRGGALPLLAAPFRWFFGGTIGSGRQGFPWIHIADVARAMDAFVKTPAYTGPVNLTAPHLINMAQFCLTVAEILNRPCWAPIPSALMRLVLGESAEGILSSPRVAPGVLTDQNFDFQFPQLPEALRDLLKTSPVSTRRAGS